MVGSEGYARLLCRAAACPHSIHPLPNAVSCVLTPLHPQPPIERPVTERDLPEDTFLNRGMAFQVGGGLRAVLKADTRQYVTCVSGSVGW